MVGHGHIYLKRFRKVEMLSFICRLPKTFGKLGVQIRIYRAQSLVENIYASILCVGFEELKRVGFLWKSIANTWCLMKWDIFSATTIRSVRIPEVLRLS